VIRPAGTDLLFPPRLSVGGILVSNTTYDSSTAAIIEAAKARTSALVSATAVHAITLGALDKSFGAQLNDFQILSPDGQPVRWALNLLHNAGLSERVYGPTLMIRVCQAVAEEGIAVYLYGSRPHVLRRLVPRLHAMAPGLRIAGYRPSRFRPATPEEDADDVQNIIQSGASILFVGLGCPRQEQWAYAHRDRLNMPVICVGAAFDFHARTLRQAPLWMQDRGLEWFFRVMMEPRRLWRRYLKYNSIFIALVARQCIARFLQSRTKLRGA
jgi:N-acetylglucosaminyldiphosphoundecaprenol N-acetyl-beta-D-mannosaminyltransferase